jgi:hypothetical protein
MENKTKSSIKMSSKSFELLYALQKGLEKYEALVDISVLRKLPQSNLITGKTPTEFIDLAISEVSKLMVLTPAVQYGSVTDFMSNANPNERVVKVSPSSLKVIDAALHRLKDSEDPVTYDPRVLSGEGTIKGDIALGFVLLFVLATRKEFFMIGSNYFRSPSIYCELECSKARSVADEAYLIVNYASESPNGERNNFKFNYDFRLCSNQIVYRNSETREVER